MSITLGCIADDLTGATDLALTLVREGMRTVQIAGLPDPSLKIPEVDAIVIALKSRTIPAEEATKMSLAACKWLKDVGARQIFFKYCSTFDSTDKGNIGPVTDELMVYLRASATIACPSFPENGRSTYMGNLFVDGIPLSESPLKDHPLTPMRDSNLVRLLSKQSSSLVGLLPFDIVEQGPEGILKAYAAGQNSGPIIYVADAIHNRHLHDLGQALYQEPLITGGSGIAQGLPGAYRTAGWISKDMPKMEFMAPSGPSVVLSGSCSKTTRQQIEIAKQSMASFEISAMDLVGKSPVANNILSRAEEFITNSQPVLVYSSAEPEVVQKVQAHLGQMEAGEMVENCMRELAVGFKKRGVRRFVVAGGETSGAVVEALGVNALEIGPEIDPGVPWTLSIGNNPIALALKSGNFGCPNFFNKAIGMIK